MESLMIELLKLSTDELKSRWNEMDAESAGDEMTTLVKYIHSHNLLPKVGFENLIGPQMVNKYGSMIERTTHEFKDAVVITSLMRLGIGVTQTYIKKIINPENGKYYTVESSIRVVD